MRPRLEHDQAFFLHTAFIKVADAFAVLAAWHLAWYVRFSSNLLDAPKGVPAWSDYGRAALWLILVFSAVFHAVGAYRSDRIRFGFKAAKKVVRGSVLATLVFVSVLYFLDAVHYSRVFLILFLGVVVGVLLVERALLEMAWRWFVERGIRRLRILLVGEGPLLASYVGKIEARRPYPFEWVGRLGTPAQHEPSRHVGYLGDEERLEEIIDAGRVDIVVVAYPTESASRYEPILELLSNEPVQVKVLPDFGRYSTFTYQAEHECGIPLLAFNRPPAGNTDRAIKRLFDIVGSATALILLSPLYLALAVLVKLSSRGPIFYSQVRVGADGKIFTIYKFRSMRLDAEEKTGAVWAVPGDPRVTPIGRLMRKTNLDELPQLYNVLRGDMSLVGPRPERPVFVDRFRRQVPKYMLRHKMKSGLTGWAQVNGWRGNTSIDERIKHDLYYIGHWSHLLDLKILLLTFLRGFNDRNAY